MISPVNLLKLLAALTLLFSVGGCTTVAAPSNLLHQAGFRPYVVRNDDQLAQVSVLPQGQISIVQRNGQSYWLFPAPARDQVFVGRQRQYNQYQRLLAQQLASNENIGSAPLEANVFVWSGGWKTWGPFFPLGEPLEY